MHWRTKKKILSADKIYLTPQKLGAGTCHEARIQIGNEYVYIDLTSRWPDLIQYHSLNGGFGLPPDHIVHVYGKSQALTILNNSRTLPGNNPDTIDTVIDLVQNMKKVR